LRARSLVTVLLRTPSSGPRLYQPWCCFPIGDLPSIGSSYQRWLLLGGSFPSRQRQWQPLALNHAQRDGRGCTQASRDHGRVTAGMRQRFSMALHSAERVAHRTARSSGNEMERGELDERRICLVLCRASLMSWSLSAFQAGLTCVAGNSWISVGEAMALLPCRQRRELPFQGPGRTSLFRFAARRC